MDVEKIKLMAEQEIKEEAFRQAVEAYKLKLKTKRSLWDRVFPWKIVFVRKDKSHD